MTASYNDGKWTPARFRSFIKSALRSASVRWPPKYTCLNEAFVGKKENKRTGRQAKHYKCAGCDGEFPLSEVNVDHIEPVIDPVSGFTTWDEVVNRMFCEQDGLQILCKTCHDVKTKQEKATSTAEKQKAKLKREQND